MATEYTPNLKLKLLTSYTEDARYNLRRIDLLGGTITINTQQDTYLRSVGNVLLEPASPDLGGSGEGGSVTFNADTVDFAGAAVTNLSLEGSLVNPNFGAQEVSTSIGYKIIEGSETLTLRAPVGLASSYQLTLPANDGIAGQVLSTDGVGVLSWVNPSGGGGGSFTSQTVSWAPGDGATKSIVHGYGTKSVMVEVLDGDGTTVDLCIERPDEDTVQLASSEVPTATWTVLLIKVD